MLHRAISATCSAMGTALLVDLAWYVWPLVPGLAFGHAMLATVVGLAVVVRAVRLELAHLERPEPGNTRGAFQISLGILLLADAAHGYALAVLGVDELPLILVGAFVGAVAVHWAFEAVASLAKRSLHAASWSGF